MDDLSPGVLGCIVPRPLAVGTTFNINAVTSWDWGNTRLLKEK